MPKKFEQPPDNKDRYHGVKPEFSILYDIEHPDFGVTKVEEPETQLPRPSFDKTDVLGSLDAIIDWDMAYRSGKTHARYVSGVTWDFETPFGEVSLERTAYKYGHPYEMEKGYPVIEYSLNLPVDPERWTEQHAVRIHVNGRTNEIKGALIFSTGAEHAGGGEILHRELPVTGEIPVEDAVGLMEKYLKVEDQEETENID